MCRSRRCGIRSNEHRIFGRASPASIPDIHDYNPGAPFGGVRESVGNPDVMEPAVWVVVFRDVLGVVNVSHVDDHVLVPIRERVKVVVCGEHIMNTASDSFVVKRCNDRVHRIRHIQNDKAIAAVCCSLSRENSVASVR